MELNSDDNSNVKIELPYFVKNDGAAESLLNVQSNTNNDNSDIVIEEVTTEGKLQFWIRVIKGKQLKF